jgi:hypothetical protein
MNRSRKINTPLTLCASALATFLALNAPLYAAEPDEELEVTMDVVDDSNHAPAGAELVVREDHEANEASHEDAAHENAEHDNAEHDDAKDDADEDHGGLDKDNDEANEHEEADVGDVNDDGHDGDGKHGSEQPGVTGHD